MIKGIQVGFDKTVQEAVVRNVAQVMATGRLIHDTFIPKFEEILTSMTGKKIARLFSSDTAAQELLFHALEIRGLCHSEQTTVIFQANGFPSPAFAAVRAGYAVGWVDVDPETLDIDLGHLEHLCQQLKSQGSWIILNVMSTAGRIPGNLPKLLSLCARYNVLVIDDAAHSFGSRRGEVGAGTWGDFTVFSFYATKPMCCGEGGAIVSDDVETVEACEYLARYGKKNQFGPPVCDWMGWSSRPTELLAAAAVGIFGGFAAATDRRQQVALKYLSDLPPKYFHQYDFAGSNFYKFPVLPKTPIDRERFKTEMKSRGVEMSAGVYDFPTYRQPAFGDSFRSTYLPGAEKFCPQHLCLPMHEFLSEGDVTHVIKAAVESYEALSE
jgi:dTDP-4-amino-4,6-dideoxygalactose transaminase